MPDKEAAISKDVTAMPNFFTSDMHRESSTSDPQLSA